MFNMPLFGCSCFVCHNVDMQTHCLKHHCRCKALAQAKNGRRAPRRIVSSTKTGPETLFRLSQVVYSFTEHASLISSSFSSSDGCQQVEMEYITYRDDPTDDDGLLFEERRLPAPPPPPKMTTVADIHEIVPAHRENRLNEELVSGQLRCDGDTAESVDYVNSRVLVAGHGGTVNTLAEESYLSFEYVNTNDDAIVNSDRMNTFGSESVDSFRYVNGYEVVDRRRTGDTTSGGSVFSVPYVNCHKSETSKKTKKKTIRRESSSTENRSDGGGESSSGDSYVNSREGERLVKDFYNFRVTGVRRQPSSTTSSSSDPYYCTRHSETSSHSYMPLDVATRFNTAAASVLCRVSD